MQIDAQNRAFSSLSMVWGMLCPTHGMESKVPGANWFSSRLGAAQIGKWSSGQVTSNTGANAGMLAGRSCWLFCPVSSSPGCPLLFCGLFCCEEGGTAMSGDGQEVSSVRRLLLPFEQPWGSGLATTTCAISTLWASRFVPDTSALLLMPFDPSRLATGSIRDWATLLVVRSKSFGCARERIMIVVNDKTW